MQEPAGVSVVFQPAVTTWRLLRSSYCKETAVMKLICPLCLFKPWHAAKCRLWCNAEHTLAHPAYARFELGNPGETPKKRLEASDKTKINKCQAPTEAEEKTEEFHLKQGQTSEPRGG